LNTLKVKEYTLKLKTFLKTGNEGSIGNKSADAAPSRQRNNKQSLSKANAKVMVKNSKYDKYPYKYEVSQ